MLVRNDTGRCQYGPDPITEPHDGRARAFTACPCLGYPSIAGKFLPVDLRTSSLGECLAVGAVGLILFGPVLGRI